MKVTIRPRVPKNKVLKVIPAQLIDRLPSTLLTEDEYALILFGMDKGCIPSAVVRKALKKVQSLKRRIIAIGSRFTLDALELLQFNNAMVVSERESFGTDESREWARIHTGARVKRPALR